MSLLLITRPGTLRDLLPPGRDRTAWYALLVQEIATLLTPAHAAILARPEPHAEGLAWHAEGTTRAVPLPALALPDRRTLLAAAGSILSDIRRLAESGRAPLVAACWPALREIPDLDCLFAVDGRPVLAAWGYAPSEATQVPGLLAAHDDGLGRMVAPPRRRHGLALGTLALVGLLLGLGLSLVERAVPQGACRLAPGQLALLARAEREAGRTAELEGRLDGLRGALRRAHAHCQIALNVRPKQPAPPALALPQQPPPALPKKAWTQHDLGMLKGCWHRFTNMTTQDPGTGRITPVASWSLCFNGTGEGTQKVVWQDGKSCTNPVQAQFKPNGKLSIRDVIQCGKVPPAPRGLFLGRMVCTRVSATEASCPGEQLAGPDAGQWHAGMFRR
jgi:hypothetical protein